MARDGAGLFYVGNYYYSGYQPGCDDDDTGERPNCEVDKVVSVWTMAADLGNVGAMDQLGRCYQYSWRLGVCYLRGEGVQRDLARAAQLFQESADDCDSRAYLGWCHLWGGCGLTRDVAKALELLKKSGLTWSLDAFPGMAELRDPRKHMNIGGTVTPWGKTYLGISQSKMAFSTRTLQEEPKLLYRT
ncbi:hypothetical protein Pelo_4988 [Pelomyxa schiedti]|nr:hypothetical protein Pelo_4988 [Pelomyxa schiedti]